MPKPPLQFTRPSRPARAGDEVGLRPAASPAINLESPEVQAFSMRGRITVPVLQDSETRTSPQPEVASDPESRVVPDETEIADPWRHVAVKLPALSGRKLAEIADRRCSKRTRVALELLEAPLRELARSHRVGEYPPLRRVTAGASRSGVSLILPQEMADDLRYVVETRSAVKAQILSRLLVPAIDALYHEEILRAGHPAPLSVSS
jgi:hypothetical protein